MTITDLDREVAAIAGSHLYAIATSLWCRPGIDRWHDVTIWIDDLQVTAHGFGAAEALANLRAKLGQRGSDATDLAQQIVEAAS